MDAQKQDVHEYRAHLADKNPELVEKAKAAARKIAKTDGLSDEIIEEIFQ